jgi:hypothetical protein
LDAVMTVQQIQALIDAAAGERGGPVQATGWYAEELYAAWSAARAESNLAYEQWCAAPGREAYTRFRAAEDRADAAEQGLARCMTGGQALPLPAAI